MLDNDVLFEICKYLKNNDIINMHLALNNPISLNIIRLLDKYYECDTCNKYEKSLYECTNCKISNCLYCSAICKKCNSAICNVYNCGKPDDDSDSEEIINNGECSHDYKTIINKHNCRNHTIKCSLCNKRLACECKHGIRCRNCLWLMCKYCGKYGICETCDGFE